MTDASTLELIKVEQEINPDDPVKAHIVNCPDDKESTAAWLTEAMVMGLPVTALCGYIWVPSRNPEVHPICDACLEQANILSME